MMIDFEDKLPAPPMRLPERLFLGAVVVMQGWGLYATGASIWSLASRLFPS